MMQTYPNLKRNHLPIPELPLPTIKGAGLSPPVMFPPTKVMKKFRTAKRIPIILMMFLRQRRRRMAVVFLSARGAANRDAADGSDIRFAERNDKETDKEKATAGERGGAISGNPSSGSLKY